MSLLYLSPKYLLCHDIVVVSASKCVFPHQILLVPAPWALDVVCHIPGRVEAGNFTLCYGATNPAILNVAPSVTRPWFDTGFPLLTLETVLLTAQTLLVCHLDLIFIVWTGN